MNRTVAGSDDSIGNRLSDVEKRLSDVEKLLAHERLTRLKYIEHANAEFDRLWTRINQVNP